MSENLRGIFLTHTVGASRGHPLR